MSVKNCTRKLTVRKGELAEQARKFADAHKPREYTVKKPSDVILPIEMLPPDELVIPLCRVSGREQNRKGNLKDQVQNIKEIVRKNGNEVGTAILHVGSGWDIAWLEKAARTLREKKGSAVVETTNRIMRSDSYNSESNPDALLHPEDVEEIKRIFKGIKVYSVLHPDSSPEQEKSYEEKRGLRMKERRERNSRRKRKGINAFRDEWIDHVRKLRKQGMSLREIASSITQQSELSISHTTIQNWLRLSIYL